MSIIYAKIQSIILYKVTSSNAYRVSSFSAKLCKVISKMSLEVPDMLIKLVK